ncbi:thiamine biosynthesis protein ThiH [Salmonella enterica subsp. enterica]|nr:thiamine biosynthesis protein ThiH [Salmonella enterica subsp. enterica]
MEAEIARECSAIRELGFEHLLLVTGEHQAKVGMDYFRRHLPAIRRQFSSLQMEVQPLSQENYAELKTLGIDGREWFIRKLTMRQSMHSIT